MVEIAQIAASNTNLKLAEAQNPAVGHGIATFDTNGPDAGEISFTFDDVIDTLNPLQHIPLISAIYRGVSGDSINPAARIAGDTFYGGVFGVASAVFSALASLTDEAFKVNGEGKSLSETVVAGLFGSNTAKLPSPAANNDLTEAALSTKATNTDPTVTPVTPAAKLAQTVADAYKAQKILPVTAAASHTAAAAAAASATSDPTMATVMGLPLDRTKLPYGGIMDTSMMQSAMQNQALALAMANGRSTLQNEHSLHSNRFATSNADPSSPTKVPSPPPASVGAAPDTAIISQASLPAPATTPTPTLDLNHYRLWPQGMPSLGSNVNVLN